MGKFLNTIGFDPTTLVLVQPLVCYESVELCGDRNQHSIQDSLSCPLQCKQHGHVFIFDGHLPIYSVRLGSGPNHHCGQIPACSVFANIGLPSGTAGSDVVFQPGHKSLVVSLSGDQHHTHDHFNKNMVLSASLRNQYLRSLPT